MPSVMVGKAYYTGRVALVEDANRYHRKRIG